MDKFVLFFVTVFLGYHVVEGISSSWAETYYWKEVIFEDLPLADDTIIGKYPYNIPTNNDINGFDYHATSGLVFATLARIRPGIPSTLNAFCVSDYYKGTSPHLWGFPNYEVNTLRASFYNNPGTWPSSRNLKSLKNSESSHTYSAAYYNYFIGNKHQDDTSRKASNKYNNFNFGYDFNIIATYFPVVDNTCDRLYVVNAGILAYSFTEVYFTQNPAILIFDLPSDGCQTRQFPLVRRVEIPSNLWTNPVGFIYITPDYGSKGSCDDVFLYLNNVFDNSITVYDYKRDNFWVFTNPTMYPIYAEAFISFENENYYVPLGISGIALGWLDKNGDRNAYYAPTSSQAEIVVSTKILKNSKRAQYKDAQYKDKDNGSDFWFIGYRGCGTQIYKQVFDEATGIIFFAEQSSHKITCWNTQLPINPDNIGVVFESEHLQYVPAISIDSEGYLWFLTNHLPIMYNTNEPLNLSDVNSRAFRIKISEAIKGTVCDSSSYSYKNNENL